MHVKMSLNSSNSEFHMNITGPSLRPEFLVEFEYVHDVEAILGRVSVLLSPLKTSPSPSLFFCRHVACVPTENAACPVL